MKRWPKSAYPKYVACIIYAEHVLQVRVDWSIFDALNEKKFGGIKIAFTKCVVPDFSYTPVSEWFKRIPKLVGELGTPIPEGRETKKPHCLCGTDNNMERVIEEAFANMDNGIEDMEDQENMIEVEVNKLINEVVNEVNFSELGANTMEIRMEELRKQHAEEIREYKARIFDLTYMIKYHERTIRNWSFANIS